MKSSLVHILTINLLAGLLFSCSLIDEKVSECEGEASVAYELQLVTNFATEIQTELDQVEDIPVATALENYLKPIFTDFAHDIDLSFYDVVGDSLRLFHHRLIVDASETNYPLSIPTNRYMHMGVANLEGQDAVSLVGDENCHGSRLHQVVADTIPIHKKGIFTSRKEMVIQRGLSQEFDVHLYMSNCASALVLDTLGSSVKDIRVFTSGFATDFDVADSLYQFLYTPIVRADKVDVGNEPGSQLCFVSVNFPSRQELPSKAVIDSPDPSLSTEGSEGLWEIRVLATLPDDTVTLTRLLVSKPLKPGQFRAIKGIVYDDGSLEPSDATITVSVSLDWKPGTEHVIVL